MSACIQAVGQGDFTQVIQGESQGEILLLKDTANHVLDQLRITVYEITKLSDLVVVDGDLGAQLSVHDLQGTWKKLVENVNSMADCKCFLELYPFHQGSVANQRVIS
jgi:hypothetical protein